jgi:cell wall-associated NlpC family hydrolase/exonuclease VII small subunit
MTILVISVLAALLGVTSPSQASPVSEKKARLREVQAKLEDVGMQVEKAVEYFNQAAARLETTRAKIAENRRLLTAAEQQLELAQTQLAARAAGMYKTPDTALTDVVFAARSFDDLVSQLDLMQRLGNSDVDLVRSVAAYEREIKDRRVELRADEKSAVRLLAQRREQRRAIAATEARMKALEDGLQEDVRDLLAQQRAAAAAAAQQAAAAATGGEASSGAGRVTGGPAAPDPGGAGHPEVVAIAQRYLGVPYLWGGASPKTGFDCSGLVLYVYAQVGVQLSHGATDQQRASKPVPLNALQPGDLVFYGNASYSYHVAIYAGGGQVIEAPRTGSVVSYDGVDDAWIGGRF